MGVWFGKDDSKDPPRATTTQSSTSRPYLVRILGERGPTGADPAVTVLKWRIMSMMMQTMTISKMTFILCGASSINATSTNATNYCHTAASNWSLLLGPLFRMLGNSPPLTPTSCASLRLHFFADTEEPTGDPACHTLCFLSSQESAHTCFEGCLARDLALRLQVFQVLPPQFPSQPAPEFLNRIQIR